MSFIQNNTSLIIVILLVLIIAEGLIIYLQFYLRNEDKSSSSRSIPIEKHKKILEERDNYRTAYEQLKEKCNKQGDNENGELINKYLQENSKLKQIVEKLTRENTGLEHKVRDLTRDNDELNKLLGNEPASSFSETPRVEAHTPDIPKSAYNEDSIPDSHAKSSPPPVQDPVPTETPNNKNVAEDDSRGGGSTEITMYASFPRTAGSSIYFSDLSYNRLDDSYFEFKVSVIYGKATFKPVDFMKIRNYDPAMAAMLTEGAKPNVASTVLGIDPGKAHIEGKDWIIDKPAKIKLA